MNDKGGRKRESSVFSHTFAQTVTLRAAMVVLIIHRAGKIGLCNIYPWYWLDTEQLPELSPSHILRRAHSSPPQRVPVLPQAMIPPKKDNWTQTFKQTFTIFTFILTQIYKHKGRQITHTSILFSNALSYCIESPASAQAIQYNKDYNILRFYFFCNLLHYDSGLRRGKLDSSWGKKLFPGCLQLFCIRVDSMVRMLVLTSGLGNLSIWYQKLL